MGNSKIQLAIVGVGKIVRDQHLPSIDKSGHYHLVATASRNETIDGVEAFKDIEAMFRSHPQIEAVSLCMPPQYRYSAARFALNEGVDVLLEKPPGATVCEVEQLAELALKNDCRLYTTWHSRHGPAVELAKEFLNRADVVVKSVEVRWNEDVNKWHPGQEWIWQAGGLGVFDPGINGLSILTYVMPEKVFVESAELQFPENKSAPIAANINFNTPSGVSIVGTFDWRVTGSEQWDINVETNQGWLCIGSGGATLKINGEFVNVPVHSSHGEYEAIYDKFADVIYSKANAVDLEPLKLVADAFLLGERTLVDAFHG